MRAKDELSFFNRTFWSSAKTMSMKAFGSFGQPPLGAGHLCAGIAMRISPREAHEMNVFTRKTFCNLCCLELLVLRPQSMAFNESSR
jgi:hypothetical protein